MLKPVAGGAGGAGFGGGPSDPLLTIPRATNLLSHQYPSSSSSSSSASSSSSYLNLPVSANSTALFRPNCTRKDKRASGSYYDSIFGSVPSRTEVEKAISDLQSFMLGFGTPDFEWLQQKLCLYGPRMMQSLGYGRVGDVFRLLQTEPSVQRMVVSISTDKAVWDAILNNNAVQNLRQSLSTAKEERPESSSSEEPDLATMIVKWILDITKAKVVELIDKFSSLVDKIFQPPDKKKPAAETSDRQLDIELRSSLLLSIVILLIVVVTRACGA